MDDEQQGQPDDGGLHDYIGSLLEVSRFRDYSPNGVQVEGKARVQRIASGVTASQRLLEAASAWDADAILVHHGYFWRNEDAAITGIKKRRIAWCTGGVQGYFEAAVALGVDAFLTGEISEQNVHMAQETARDLYRCGSSCHRALRHACAG